VKAIEAMRQAISQAEFGAWVGISEARVSQLMAEGVLTRGETGHEWLIAYCERMRDIAAGRASSETGGLDLVQERAALAREQRIGVAFKNGIARGEYIPVVLMTQVLATASQTVSEHNEQLPGTLRKVSPEWPEAARDAVMGTLSDMRNAWVRTIASAIAELMRGPAAGANADVVEDLDDVDHNSADDAFTA
jgi:phage terminase Nu1 subunit (DNA packaging protein)